MATHLHEAAIVGTSFAEEDRLHCGLHVVVNAASAGGRQRIASQARAVISANITRRFKG
jgi:hypothetical protein